MMETRDGGEKRVKLFNENFSPLSNATEEELKKVKAELTAIRERCKKKAESNTRLSMELDRLRHRLRGQENQFFKEKNALKDVFNTESIAEMIDMYKIITNERDEYKKAAIFHISEVEKGNEYRQKLKETIEKLHKTLEHEMNEKQKFATFYQETKKQAERYERILDHITGIKLF